MKKLDYMIPQMELIELDLNSNVLLTTSSDDTPGIGGEGDDEEAG